MRNQKGFSLIEMMVAVSMLSLVAFVTSGIVTSMTRTQNQLKKELESGLDTMLAENIIFVDLKNVDPSYNQVSFADDNGQNFFDYFPDVPEAMLGNQKTRSLTMSLNGRKKDFTFLQVDTTAGTTLIYDPALAYAIGNPPSSFNQAATLAFVSLNQRNALSTQRPQFWVNGRLLMLDTLARLRPMVNGQVNLLTPPRSPAFIGRVSGNSLATDGLIRQSYATRDPVTALDISSADLFLRNVPEMGGGPVMVRVRPVQIVHYYLAQQANQPVGVAQLFKEVYDNGQFARRFLIGDQIQSVRFDRPSVTRKVINYEVEKRNEK